MATTETLSASLEDYLEAIFHIIKQKQAVRAKDISRRLTVSSSSVTGALHSMAERGLINYAPYDVITLTAKGKAVAEDVIRRHEVLQLGMNWNRFDSPIQEIVSTGLGYKSALRGALYIFAKGADKIKGLGLQLYETGEQLFYQRTQIVIESVLSNSDFANMGIILDDLKKTIKTIGWNILEEQTEPYLHDPELIHTLAVAKRTWWKKIKDLQPMKEEISHG